MDRGDRWGVKWHPARGRGQIMHWMHDKSYDVVWFVHRVKKGERDCKFVIMKGQTAPMPITSQITKLIFYKPSSSSLAV